MTFHSVQCFRLTVLTMPALAKFMNGPVVPAQKYICRIKLFLFVDPAKAHFVNFKSDKFACKGLAPI